VNAQARTVFLGSGGFAVPIGAALARHQLVELVGVVTAPDRAGGRGGSAGGSPVGRWAADAGIPTLTPLRLRDPDAIGQVTELEPDLIVLADYGQIVPRQLLELPRHGALNLHPSLLPRHRGASPIPAAILAGDDRTGVSLMLMDAGLDTGPLIAQLPLPLGGSETAPELEARLADMASNLLADQLEPWLDAELTPTEQPSEGATLTRQLRREDGRLDPQRPAAQLERQVRALQPWPGSFVETPVGRIVVWRAEPDARHVSQAPGTLAVRPAERGGPGLALVTSGGLLELLEVQPQGGRRMTGAELLRGRPGLAGASVAVASEAGSQQ
jgi:methionyl-tRNA formyltransferase